MMKALKWFGIVAGTITLFLLTAIVITISRDLQWQASISPLTVEEIRRVSKQFDANRTVQNPEPTKQILNTPKELTATPVISRPEQMRLATVPTREQLLNHFRQHSGVTRMQRGGELFLEKVIGSTIYRARPDSTAPWVCSIPGQIGRQYVNMGDFDTARNYLRQAVRVEKNEAFRGYLCEQLAWIEDDPQVAVELLLQACATKPLFTEGEAQCDALNLAVATGSEDLAKYFYYRYHHSWSEWGMLSADTEKWISELESK